MGEVRRREGGGGVEPVEEGKDGHGMFLKV